jgi:SOS-response transcriptional repressor LexA
MVNKVSSYMSLMARFCHSDEMANDFDIELIRANLRRIMGQRDVKPTTLSLAVGKSPSLVHDFLERTADPRIGTLYKLAKELNCDISALLSEQFRPVSLGPTLYVKGKVAAGKWIEALEEDEGAWEEFTGRDNVTADPTHRFGLRVCGDSMDEIYPEGTIIECVNLFGRADFAHGKKVVILRERDDHLIEATVKELVDIDGEWWAKPRSSNPAHQAFKLSEPGEGIIEVKVIAVVVSSVREE